MLKNYVMAGYPAIILTTPEEDRALRECKTIAKNNNMSFAYWSITQGLKIGCTNEGSRSLKDPIAVLEEGLKMKNTMFCILDFHPLVKSTNVWRKAKDVFKVAKTKGITYVFISVMFEVPPELEREVIVTSLPLPTREEIQTLLTKMAQQHKVMMPQNPTFIVEAALGLTLNEVENAFAMSIATLRHFDAKLISKVKEQIICNGGLLEYRNSDETLESIGGLKSFTSWALTRFSAYSEEARAYGLPYPRGVLLIGIPGCGKSLTAKALANIWQKPLLRLDIGKLFGSLVGETEMNTRRALETAEAMSPAILWIDEIEKGLSGIQSSGKTDSGTTSRMFGNLLTWLQEKKAPVFVIATANDISQLPPEFLRKGRFDEVFFVDLPDSEERKDIFRIQLKKYKRTPEKFDVDTLANETVDYTGAEIEEAIVSALFFAWNDGQREMTTEDIQNAMKEMSPMATGIMKERIDILRNWSKTSGIRKANGIMPTKQSLNSIRTIRYQQEEE